MSVLSTVGDRFVFKFECKFSESNGHQAFRIRGRTPNTTNGLPEDANLWKSHARMAFSRSIRSDIAANSYSNSAVFRKRYWFSYLASVYKLRFKNHDSQKNRHQSGASDTGEALQSPNNRPTIQNLNPNDENPATLLHGKQ